jgi:hypothetical protein
MGGIYVAILSDGLRCHDIHTKLHKNKFRHSKVGRWEFTDTQRARASHSLLLFFQKKKSNPKRRKEEKAIFHHFVP